MPSTHQSQSPTPPKQHLTQRNLSSVENDFQDEYDNPPSKRPRLSPRVNISELPQKSLIDLPKIALSKIVNQLHYPTDVINRRGLRELEDVFNLAKSCDSFNFDFTMYAKEAVNLSSSSSHISAKYQSLGSLKISQYPILFRVLSVCSTTLRKVWLPRDFSPAYLEFFLWTLSQTCPNISEISFCHCSNPTSDHLARLSEFPNLTNLEVENATTTVLGYLEQEIPLLERLSLLKFPFTLLTCLHHSLNTRASRLKTELGSIQLKTLNIFLQREERMKSTDFTAFFCALKQPEVHYVIHLEHLHLIIPGWTGSLEALKARMTSNRNWFYSRLKLEITKWSMPYDRKETSAVAYGKGTVIVQRHFLGSKWYELAPENVDVTIQELKKSEAIVLSDEIFRKFSREAEANMDGFYEKLKSIDSVEELVWDSRGVSNKKTFKFAMEIALKTLQSMSCIRRLKLYMGNSNSRLINLFSICTNIRTVWLSFAGTRTKTIDADICFVTAVTKELRSHCQNIESMVVEIEENPPKVVTNQSCQDLSNQIDKLENDFPYADFESLRFWHEYFTKGEN